MLVREVGGKTRGSTYPWPGGETGSRRIRGPVYSVRLTGGVWIQPQPPGGGAGKGGVSNWLKAEGPRTTLLRATTEPWLHTISGPQGVDPLPPGANHLPSCCLAQRFGEPPGLTKQTQTDPHPGHTWVASCTRSVQYLPSGKPLPQAGLERERDVGVQQLPADPREFLAGRSQLICTRVCPRRCRCAPPTAGSGREHADLFWLAFRSTPTR